MPECALSRPKARLRLSGLDDASEREFMRLKIGIGLGVIILTVAIYFYSQPRAAAKLVTRAAFPEWYEKTEPFHIIGNLYYVGSRGLAVYLLPSDDGHILIDGGLPDTAPLVAESMEKLGYRLEDVKILLNTHAHSDHAGGLAELKEKSGAKLLISEGDRSAVENGLYAGYEDRESFSWPGAKVDGIVSDGEVVRLGGIELTAHITPGHSPGCTSWSFTIEDGPQNYDALIFCSASVAANSLIDPPQYPGIVDDYRATFAKTKGWAPDIFLSNHPFFFKMTGKRIELEEGDPLAFVKPGEFTEFIIKAEQDFERELKDQSN